MSNRGSIKFKNFPNTYFFLLPAELQLLLTSYYYGPLEMNFFLLEKSQRLRIVRFDTNNKADTAFVLIGKVDKLVEKRNTWSGSGWFYLNSGKIEWNSNKIEIQLGEFLDDYNVFLTDWMAELFWEKLQTIVDRLRHYHEQGLSQDQISDKFRPLTF